MENMTIQFPRSTEVEFGASRWVIIKTEIRMWFDRLMNRVGLPGAIANQRIDDTSSGLTIIIRTGLFGTTVNINGRDFVFSRYSGKLCGTGTGCVSGCMSGPLPDVPVKIVPPIQKA